MEFSQSTAFSGRIITWSPLTLLLLLVAVGVVLFCRRKWILPTFIAASVLMSLALHLVIMGQNLMPHRVLLLCGLARLIARGEHRGFTFSKMDKAFLMFCSYLVLTETIQFGLPGFTYAVANSGLDGLGTYFLFRLLFREAADVRRVIGALAAVCMVVAGFMFVEYMTGRNWLSLLGAVQDLTVSRKGRPRCAASFSIAITAGTFGAVLLPLFVASRWQGGSLKKWAVPGIIASTIITVTSGSASPLSTYLIAILGLLAWRFHSHMRRIRWVTLIGLIVLHLCMTAPVWALIMRIQIVPGSSAYHRYNILDTFIRHFSDWWLCGVKSTGQWGWEIDDVANQYCVIAKHGGLLALVLFIRVISLGFREVGTTLQLIDGDWSKKILAWAFGVMLFAHVTAFFGISYFDQMKLAWYIGLAMIASMQLLAEPEELTADSAEELGDAAGLEGQTSAT